MRLARKLAGTLLVLALGVLPLPAQTTGAGTVEGIVTDPQQVALPGATVILKSPSTGFENAAISGTDGRYRIASVPPATDYILQVSFAGGGYATVTQDRIVVRAERTTVESVQLFEEQTEQVIVSAKKDSRRVVDLEQVGQVTEFNAEFLEGLPLLGRNYQDILTLAAGVVDPNGDGNPNVLGARAENFQAVIDGVSNQDPLGGTFLSNLNTDAIEAVEVIQTGADASFRRASGGFANIITKSGSNEFEGTFNVSFRSSLFDGNGQTGDEEVDFRSLRPALTMSGAVVKDKLWFFFTDEEFNDDIPINTLAGRGTLVREVNGRRFLAKLTWAVNSNNKLSAQLRSDPLEFTNLGINASVLQEAGFTQEQGGPFYNVQLDTVFSPTVLLKSLVALTDTGLDLTPNNPQRPDVFSEIFLSEPRAFEINQDTGAVSGSFWLRSTDQRKRLTYSEDLTIFVDDFFGRHDIAAGVSYEKEDYQADQFLGVIRSFRLVNNFFGSTSDGDVGAGGKRFAVNEALGVPAGQAGFNHLAGSSDNYGLYVTDTWLPRSNLSITAGLRWDREEVQAEGFEQFNVVNEFNAFQRFMLECTQAAPGTQDQAATNILAREFPDLLSAFVANGGLFTPSNGCVQARPFFLTFPKAKFINDCRTPSNDGYCTQTLNNFSPVLNIKGTRAPDTVQVNNNNLSPRFSISWDPWSNGKTKFFGTWGRFYDKTNLAVITAEQGPDFRTLTYEYNTSLGRDGAKINVNTQASDPSIQLVNRNLRTEFNEEWTIGFEREIAPETKIRLTYISRRFRNQLQDVDINHFVQDRGPEYRFPVTRQVGLNRVPVGTIPGGGQGLCVFSPTLEGLTPVDDDGRLASGGVSAPQRGILVVGELDQFGKPAATGNGIGDDCFGQFQGGVGGVVADGVPDLFRRNVLYNNVQLLDNLNFSTFDGFTLEFIRRLKRNWQLTASWTHSRSLGAADQFADESGNDPSLVDDEFGFTGFDIRDVVTVSITTILPWGDMQLGSIMRYFSGTPFSIRKREFSFDSAGQGTLRTTFPSRSRNDQRNEPHIEIDMTLEKGFLIKKYNATAQFLVQNLLADDWLTVQNLQDGQLIANRNFGRQYEVRFKINF